VAVSTLVGSVAHLLELKLGIVELDIGGLGIMVPKIIGVVLVMAVCTVAIAEFIVSKGHFCLVQFF
jgi:hypothetical protein